MNGASFWIILRHARIAAQDEEDGEAFADYVGSAWLQIRYV